MTPQEQPDSQARCKTCGGTPPHHIPSVFDRNGIGHPDHKMNSETMEAYADSQAGDELDSLLKKLEFSVMNYKVTEENWESKVYFKITGEFKAGVEAYAERLAAERAIKEIDDVLFNYSSLIVASPRHYLEQRKAALTANLTKETK